MEGGGQALVFAGVRQDEMCIQLQYLQPQDDMTKNIAFKRRKQNPAPASSHHKISRYTLSKPSRGYQRLLLAVEENMKAGGFVSRFTISFPRKTSCRFGFCVCGCLLVLLFGFCLCRFLLLCFRRPI